MNSALGACLLQSGSKNDLQMAEQLVSSMYSAKHALGFEHGGFTLLPCLTSAARIRSPAPSGMFGWFYAKEIPNTVLDILLVRLYFCEFCKKMAFAKSHKHINSGIQRMQLSRAIHENRNTNFLLIVHFVKC